MKILKIEAWNFAPKAEDQPPAGAAERIRSHLLSLRQLFFVSPGVASDIAARLYLRSSRLLLFSLEQNKRKSLKRPRPVAASNWICFYCRLFSFVLLNIIIRHIAIISAALLFCSIFFFCSPRYLLWTLARLLLFRAVDRWSLCCFRPFSIALEPRILLFQPWAKQKKSLKAPMSGPASYCLANTFYCFQARSREFA